MGRSRYKITEPNSPHFLTNTIVNWIPVFTRPASVQIILDSFSYIQNHHEFKIYGYVILENHIHWIAQSEDLNLEKSVGSRFLAQAIDSTALQKNARLTEWVRLRFFQSTVKPLACTINPRPTDLSRLNKDVARFKAYTAKRLVNYLAEAGQQKILQQFAFL